MSPNTAATYARGMGKFWTWFRGQDVYKSMRPRALRAWFADMRKAGHKPKGIATHNIGVRAFFAWDVTERGLASNPCVSVKSSGNGKRHRSDPLSGAEVLRVLAQPDTTTTLGKVDRAILALMAYTGVSPMEVRRAKVGDLRSRRGGCKLRLVVQGKGHEKANEVAYLVHPDVVDAMHEWLAAHPRGDEPDAPLFPGLSNRNRGRALNSSWIREMVKDACHKAGIRDPRKTTHSLRLALVANLIRHNVPAAKIMAVTRHRRLDTILAYAREVDRDSDPAEAYVDYCSGGGAT